MSEQARPLPEPLQHADLALWHIALDVPAPGGDEVAIGLRPMELVRWQAFRHPLASACYAHMRLRFGMAGHSLVYEPQDKLNLSHSGACGCIALSEFNEVGVDIELNTASVPSVDTFTERALAHVRSAGTRGFYRIWTHKEAVLEALGSGFAVDARAMCVAPAPGGDPSQGARYAAVRLWSVDAILGCSATVTCRVPQQQVLTRGVQSHVGHHFQSY
ncbi:4'-phosphopantetheinyl transferase superfamily protein [Verminephrobacter aporrectodeae subsp. tuberculatae]|uniref:4'-phosphopantetheinyl transferase family protein n=1 Tax=Verminephrobacter aporrectodeae TaxID=1110389 RepID=UPI002237DD97|nr:4'-phosphopantetheinyl transferase superfamily protein [Verminephrobacter aporrectodeae]MCW5256023.1 4'-phosphopantetheinyl transferase superfamily protein [Verminephrobacter aporrectodeae subsp. tuberculatae]